MKTVLNRLFNHEILSRKESKEILLNITHGLYNEAQIAALLTVYKMRSVSVEELIGFREALLESRIRIDLSEFSPIDIVGTGGDGKNTFNISTCACFVVAGAGYKVAKHGNYGATSVSGASNVIEQHGVKFTNDESKLRRSIEQCNIAYLHAPLFNPAMKTVAPTRKSLQVSTIFNLLGPLVNPVLPPNQLLGVANLSLMRLYAQVFQALDMEFAVVTSLDGYDEISLTNEFKVIMKHIPPRRNGYSVAATPRAVRRKYPTRSRPYLRRYSLQPGDRIAKRLRPIQCRICHTSFGTDQTHRRMHRHSPGIARKRKSSENTKKIHRTKQLTT